MPVLDICDCANRGRGVRARVRACSVRGAVRSPRIQFLAFALTHAFRDPGLALVEAPAGLRFGHARRR